jgi:hypothetical protein
MSNINKLVQEAVSPGYSGYTRKEMGSGVGKMVGGAVGSLPGAVMGHYVGKGSVDNPEGKIDERKPLHRMGVLTDKTYGMKQLKSAGIGAALGGAGLAALAKHGGAENPALFGAIGAGTGAVLGAGASAARQGWKAAKRLGYGTIGKTAAATPMIGGLTGIARPKALKNK